MAATVYAIAGGKGGVGKTTTAANLGVTLRATGQAVALVDADFSMPNLRAVFALSDGPTLHEVLGGEASLADARVEHVLDAAAVRGHLDVYPGSSGLDAYANTELDRLDEVVDGLAEDYDSLILDTGPGLTHDVALPLELADKTIVVTTPAELAVGDAQKTMQLVRHIGGTIEGIVISRLCEGLSDEEIAERMGTDRLTTIPNFAIAGRDIIEAYRRLAVRLLVGTDVSVDAADDPVDAEVLVPYFASRLDFDPDADAGEPDRARQDSSDADADSATDGMEEENSSDDVPGWFTGVVD